jgi:hypothetical protein
MVGQKLEERRSEGGDLTRRVNGPLAVKMCRSKITSLPSATHTATNATDQLAKGKVGAGALACRDLLST